MHRNASFFCFLALALAACSSAPSGSEAKKAAAPPEKIQGKALVIEEQLGTLDQALNAGGPSSVYLVNGLVRYRLFFKTPTDIVNGNQYVAEGVNAQKTIDDIGDPDNGKNGYPLEASCERVVTKAWSNLAFDDLAAEASALRARVQRYPARPVFLVEKISPADAAGDAQKADADKDAKPITVPADKQKALLIEGPAVQTAPLWNPDGGTVQCKLIIGTDGKVSELETGKQLCEAVPWDKFSYKPTVQGGHPVKVETEVEVRFDPKKADAATK